MKPTPVACGEDATTFVLGHWQRWSPCPASGFRSEADITIVKPQVGFGKSAEGQRQTLNGIYWFARSAAAVAMYFDTNSATRSRHIPANARDGRLSADFQVCLTFEAYCARAGRG